MQKLIVPLQVTKKHWILYGNLSLKVDQYHTKLTSSYFSCRGLPPGDIVKITGPMFKEQKMFYTNLVLAGQRTSAIGATGDDVVFSLTGFIATRALGAACWDGPSIDGESIHMDPVILTWLVLDASFRPALYNDAIWTLLPSR